MSGIQSENNRMITPGELYWSLFSIALNTMIQPCGSICGFEPSRSIYLRSSPFVCIADTSILTIRFINYIYQGQSPFSAARAVLRDRRYDFSTTLKNARGPESPRIFRFGVFIVGIAYSFAKLSVSSGILWSKIWACCYFASFLTWFVLGQLAGNAPADPISPSLGRLNSFSIKLDQGIGYVAVCLQFIPLAWVDFAAKEPDRDLSKRYRYRGFRLGGHIIALFIHAIFISIEGQALRLPSSLRKTLPIVLALLILGILVILHGLDYRYTLYSFFYSLITAIASWLLYIFPFSRELVCVFGEGDYKNVLVFDFFWRIFFLSLFWYFRCYQPFGTSKPEWATFFG
jgi:hypothetical protein